MRDINGKTVKIGDIVIVVPKGKSGNWFKGQVMSIQPNYAGVVIAEVQIEGAIFTNLFSIVQFDFEVVKPPFKAPTELGSVMICEKWSYMTVDPNSTLRHVFLSRGGWRFGGDKSLTYSGDDLERQVAAGRARFVIGKVVPA